MFPTNSECLIGISDAFFAFVYGYPSSCPRIQCTPNKSATTLRYTRRHGHTHTHTCTHTHTSTHTHTRTQTHAHTYTHIHTRKPPYTHTHTNDPLQEDCLYLVITGSAVTIKKAVVFLKKKKVCYMLQLRLRLYMAINPFTATACKMSGLNSAHTHASKQYI